MAKETTDLGTHETFEITRRARAPRGYPRAVCAAYILKRTQSELDREHGRSTGVVREYTDTYVVRLHGWAPESWRVDVFDCGMFVQPVDEPIRDYFPTAMAAAAALVAMLDARRV